MCVYFCVCQRKESVSDGGGGMVGWIGLVWRCIHLQCIYMSFADICCHCGVFPESMLCKLLSYIRNQLDPDLTDGNSSSSRHYFTSSLFPSLLITPPFPWTLRVSFCFAPTTNCLISESLGREPPQVPNRSVPFSSNDILCKLSSPMSLPLKSVLWVLT